MFSFKPILIFRTIVQPNPGLAQHTTVKALVILILCACVQAQDVNQWRGPHRDGKYSETGLLSQWPSGGPKLLWVFDGLGKGFSSAAVTHDRVYATGMVEKKGFVFCFDLNGKLVWQKAYGPEWDGSYPGARSTPTIVDNRIYIMSGYAVALCLEARSGQELWKIDLRKRFDARVPYFGFAESPLVFEDKVVFSPSGKTHNIIALDQKTGTTLWTSKAKAEEHAYCSPILFRHHGRKFITSVSEVSIFALDAENGCLLWAFPHKTREPDHGNSPIYHQGKLLCVGSQSDGIMLQLSQDGSRVSELWRNPKLESQWGGAVIIDGRIYASGSSHRKSQQWMCIDAHTGKQEYASRAMGHGIVLYADGLLYCYSHRGELGIMKPRDKDFQLLGKIKINRGSEQHFAHPTIKNGVLYLRHGTALMAFDIKTGR